MRVCVQSGGVCVVKCVQPGGGLMDVCLAGRRLIEDIKIESVPWEGGGAFLL
jgi:hypothetical protein